MSNKDKLSSGLIGQREQRILKAKKLREMGIDPYPSKVFRTNHVQEVLADASGFEKKEVTLAGRVMAIRKHGQIIFMDLQDSTGKIQLYIKDTDISETNKKEQSLGFNDLELLDIGDIVESHGVITQTNTGQTSLLVKKLRILVKALRPLPDKRQGIQDEELKFRQRYLDLLMDPSKRERFEKFAKLTFSIRKFLSEKGFLEIKTPMLQPVYGGGMAKPFKTFVNALNSDFFLAISHELYLKRLITAGFEKVFNINGYFRNEGIDRSHNPEFTMLETMTAYENYEYNMDLIEEMYKFIAKDVFGKTTFNVQGTEVDFSKPWERISMADAVKKHTGVDFLNIKDLAKAHDSLAKNEVEERPKSIGESMSVLFESKVEKKIISPTFVYGHPVEISPLAKSMAEDSRFAERFEIFIGGVEGGDNWTELNDPEELFSRFKDQVERRREGDDEAHPMDIEFVEMMEYGMPPTSGLGPGIERLAMIFTETEYIDDVIFFPMLRPQKVTKLQEEIYGDAVKPPVKKSKSEKK